MGQINPKEDEVDNRWSKAIVKIHYLAVGWHRKLQPCQSLTVPTPEDKVCGQKESKYPQDESQTNLGVLSI